MVAKVFLGNMPYHEDEVNEDEIRDMFKKYGPISKVIIKKGYGFIEFEDQQGAEDACREMDHVEFQNKKLRVSMAYTDEERKRRPSGGAGFRPDARDDKCNSLFVANIPPDTTIERLKDFFEKYGRVENVKVLPQMNNNPNISAFVDFEDHKAAARAHDADLSFEGKFLRTDFSSNRRNKRTDDRRDDRGGRYDRRRDYSPPPRNANRSRSRDRSRGRRDDPPRRRDDRSPPRRRDDDRRDDRSPPRRRDDDRRDDRRDPPRDDRRDDRRDAPRDFDDRRNDAPRRNDRSPPPQSRDNRPQYVPLPLSPSHSCSGPLNGAGPAAVRLLLGASLYNVPFSNSLGGGVMLGRLALGQVRRCARNTTKIAKFSKLHVPVTSTPKRSDFMAIESDIAGMQQKIRDFYSKGDFVAALDMAEICRDTVKDHFGEDHPVFASTLNNMALMQKNLSQLDEAILTYQQALRVYKNCVGENHASWATTLHNLGGVYRLQSHALKGMQKVACLDQALECFEESLRVRREILAADHPDIAMSMCNVGILYWHTNKRDKAEEMLLDAVDRLEKKVGPKSPLTAIAWNNLAIIYKELGKYDEAVELYSRTTAVRASTLGESHVETITSMHNWAEALRAAGRDEEAAKIQSKIMDLVGVEEDEVEQQK